LPKTLLATYPQLASYIPPIFQSLLKLVKAFHIYRLLIIEELVLKHLSQTQHQLQNFERNGRSIEQVSELLFPINRKPLTEIINDPKKFEMEEFWKCMSHFLAIQPTTLIPSSITTSFGNYNSNSNVNPTTPGSSYNAMAVYTTLITGPVPFDAYPKMTSNNGVMLHSHDANMITMSNFSSLSSSSMTNDGIPIQSSMSFDSSHFGGSGLSTDEFLAFMDLARYSRDPSNTGLHGSSLSGAGGSAVSGRGGGGFLNMYGVSEELPEYAEIENEEGVGRPSGSRDPGY
jgi:hypothetical protein